MVAEPYDGCVHRDLWVDFHRTDGEGLTHASIKDVTPGVELTVGKFVVVWDEGADDGVAEVVRIDPDGFVLVRVLPGPAADHLDLIGSSAGY
jgi:hypothetical protein